MLESLGKVYSNDAVAREQTLSAAERLRFHREQSDPVMKQLHTWLEAQLAEKDDIQVAVGTIIADRPPHRSVRAALPHTAPTLDVWRQIGRSDKDAESVDEAARKTGPKTGPSTSIP